jgi:signal transduction histidine kinase
MSQSIKGRDTSSSHAAASESITPDPAIKECAPQSSFYSRKAPEACLAELAMRSVAELPLADVTQQALAVLSELLPECRAEIRDPEFGPDSSTEVLGLERSLSSPLTPQASARALGRCEWRLSEGNEGPSLVVSLRQTRRPREVARVLDIGERVARILSAAMRRETIRQVLLSQTQEIAELRRRVIQAEKLASYGQLVASVLHDLNNPLTAIVAYAEYFTRTFGGADIPTVDLERLSHLKDAADTVLQRARGLVEYACPPRTPFTQVDLVSVIHRALALCEHEFSRKRLGVHTHFGSRLSCVSGHAEHLTQLFVNLFTNAAHAALGTNAALNIQVSAQAEPARILVQVHDNGVGIQPTDIDHIFDPFYTTKCGSGYGLGLSIVSDIVKHHGGHITVESTPAVGTTFNLSLPVAGTTKEEVGTTFNLSLPVAGATKEEVGTSAEKS